MAQFNLPLIISGKLYDTDSSTLIPNALITARNESTGERTTAYTNSEGFYAIDCANFTTSGYRNGDKVTVYALYHNADVSATITISENITAVGGTVQDLILVAVTDSSLIHYCTVQDVWDELDGKSASDISAERVVKVIQRAEAEINKKTQRIFYTSDAVTDYLDVNEYTVWRSPEQLFYMSNGVRNDRFNSLYYSDRIRTKNRPIVSVTSLSKNEAGVSEADSWTALTEKNASQAGSWYIADANQGLLDFLSDMPRFGKRAIKIVYTHGSAITPKEVEDLTVMLAVKRILLSKISSSTFTSVDNISIRGISITKGQGSSVSYAQYFDSVIKDLWEAVSKFNSEVV